MSRGVMMIDPISAISDPKLFRSFFGSLSSWCAWRAFIGTLFGLSVPKKYHQLVERCSGKSVAEHRSEGYREAYAIVGRRSGKSRIAAVLAAWVAGMSGLESKLAKGELGYVALISTTKQQARIVRSYVRATFDCTPMLRDFVASEDSTGFLLKNGVRIEILAGDWRTVRGYTLLAAIVDEACFFGVEAESKIKNDKELYDAIKPGLATTGGMLLFISSPYAKKGHCYSKFKSRENKNASHLFWMTDSRTMNPTLPQSVVDEAMEADPAAARAEYGGQWREDVGQFIPREIVENLVVDDRMKLLSRNGVEYVAFVDMSGGRSDDAVLAIAHKKDRTGVIDLVQRWGPPFNPHTVIGQMCEVCREYGIQRVTGDNYAAEFVSQAFNAQRLKYERCEKPKSVLYAELLPRLCSGEIELLDDERLVTQLASLERRTRSGGRDIIDHPPGGHDDVANAVAGVACVLMTPRFRVGALRRRYSLN